jgi:hypothetical protein
MFRELTKALFPFAPSADGMPLPGMDLDAVKELQADVQKTALAQSSRALALNRKLVELQQAQLSRAGEAFNAQLAHNMKATMDAWKMSVDAVLDAHKAMLDELPEATPAAEA